MTTEERWTSELYHRFRTPFSDTAPIKSVPKYVTYKRDLKILDNVSILTMRNI